MARVLLDESVPRQLAQYLPGHHVETVPARGWAGARNGELLQRASFLWAPFVPFGTALFLWWLLSLRKQEARERAA